MNQNTTKTITKISATLIMVLAYLFASTVIHAQTNQGENMQDKKILVAYFSRVGNTDFGNNIDALTSASLHMTDGTLTGNTELVAKTIHNLVGGDLFRIETVKRYPREYGATTDEAMSEQKQNARPALSTQVQNMESYDIMYVGFPDWWGTLPMALFTFLESYDFSGKTIIPFCTHGGSGFGTSISDIKKLSPRAIVLEGLAIHASNVRRSQNDISSWLRKIAMIK